MIIQKLAEDPLKKPEELKSDDTIVPQTNDGSQMKTVVLEKTINKIGNLLQRGFGELGAKVVAKTLRSDERFMDYMTGSGERIDMVFSVVRIKQFTETTDQLQNEIIVFVNKIVKIIHDVGKQWDGEPAKNFGEKYLLVWKLPMIEKEGAKAANQPNG